MESPGEFRREIPFNTRVKICGITRSNDAIVAERCGADAIGVVMCSLSPRTISTDQVKEIFASVGPYISRVVVTHTTKRSELTNILRLHPDAIQISHGFPLIPEMKIIQVIVPGDPLRTDCDALIVDGSRGNGVPFDREYVRRVRKISLVPLIIAGGLIPETVRDVVRDLRPHAVDVCSGVEIAPGIKDPEKIRLFIREVHDAGHAEQSLPPG
jgi:phosphoribosylanthranilate isomerase